MKNNKRIKEIEMRLDKIENNISKNTEATVSKMESVEEKYDFKEEIIYEGQISRHGSLFKNLIEKANELGFKKGVKIKNHQGEFTLNVFDLESMRISNHYNQGFWINDESQLENPGIWILFNGVWADIISDNYKPAKSDTFKDPLSIREVQVKVTSQEEANECAEIAKACGENVKLEVDFRKEEDYFFRFSYDYNDFDLYYEDEIFKEITIQEYRERFGKSTEIDWSKSGQLVTNDFGCVWRITGNHTTTEFEGVCIKLPNYMLLGDTTKIFKEYSDVEKDGFKLCTEPITLKNE